MELLLFGSFFIGSLVFFIVGKDDFGRTKNNLSETIKVSSKIDENTIDNEKSENNDNSESNQDNVAEENVAEEVIN